MIQSKQDLQYCLERDKLALHYAFTDKTNIKMKFGSGKYF